MIRALPYVFSEVMTEGPHLCDQFKSAVNRDPDVTELPLEVIYMVRATAAFCR